MSENRLEGEVVSYEDDRGFGFIRDASGTDYFVRFNEVESGGFRTLQAGQRVSFLPHQEPPGGEVQARSVLAIDSPS